MLYMYDSNRAAADFGQGAKSGSAEVGLSSGGPSAGAGVDISDDSSWGRRPAALAGIGTDESFRKFAACRRKYLVLYLDLLAKTGDADSLMAAYQFLTNAQQWPNLNIMADIARHVESLLFGSIQPQIGGVRLSRDHLRRIRDAILPSAPL
jgi:hypothetical protein